FFLAGSKPSVLRPRNGWPITSLLQSDKSQKPPTMVPVSIPFASIGGWPGAANDSTVASHSPARSLRTECSGPGWGMGGAMGAAGAAGDAPGGGMSWIFFGFGDGCADADAATSARITMARDG